MAAGVSALSKTEPSGLGISKSNPVDLLKLNNSCIESIKACKYNDISVKVTRNRDGETVFSKTGSS